MKKNSSGKIYFPLRIVFTIAVLLMLTESTAHAYIDPGTGSVVLQLLAGLFFAALMTVKQWGAFVMGLLKKKPKTDDVQK